jgi:hypothetical protein
MLPDGFDGGVEEIGGIHVEELPDKQAEDSGNRSSHKQE